MIAHNVYVWRRRGAWENDQNVYDNVINGFPKREPREATAGQMRAFWNVYHDRRQNKYDLTTAEQDEQIYGRRLA